MKCPDCNHPMDLMTDFDPYYYKCTNCKIEIDARDLTESERGDEDE